MNILSIKTFGTFAPFALLFAFSVVNATSYYSDGTSDFLTSTQWKQVGNLTTSNTKANDGGAALWDNDNAYIGPGGLYCASYSGTCFSIQSIPTGPKSLVLDNSAVFQNNATLTIASGSTLTLDNGPFSSLFLLEFKNTSSLDLLTSADSLIVKDDGVLILRTGSTLNNNGTLRVETGGQIWWQDNLNSGSLQLAGGTITISDFTDLTINNISSISGGAFIMGLVSDLSIDPGATLNITAVGTVFDTNLTLPPAFNQRPIIFNNGIIDVDSNEAILGAYIELLQDGGELNIYPGYSFKIAPEARLIYDAGQITISQGNIFSSGGVLTNEGFFQNNQTAYTLGSNGSNGNSIFNNQGTFENTFTLTLQGTFNQMSGILDVRAPLTNQGTFNYTGGSIIDSTPGSFFQNQGIFNANSPGNSIGNDITFVNNSTGTLNINENLSIAKLNQSGAVNIAYGKSLTNTSQFDYNGGSIDNQGTLINQGTLNFNASGLLIGGNGTLQNEGILNGSGIISGVLNNTNTGVINPGNSPGVIEVGNYIESGSLNIQLGGAGIPSIVSGTPGDPGDPATYSTAYDIIFAAGLLTDSGINGDVLINSGSLINVTLDAYTPQLGDVFDILVYNGTLTGAYDNLISANLPSLDPGLVWVINYHNTTAVPFSGGGSLRLSVASAVVPEPTTYLLLATYLLFCIALKKRNYQSVKID